MYTNELIRFHINTVDTGGGGGRGGGGGGGRFKDVYELVNLRALTSSHAGIIHIFQYMGKIFCVDYNFYTTL